jgi:5-methylcytosine-specific restriction endonuclease McrA
MFQDGPLHENSGDTGIAKQLVRDETRARIRAAYPVALRWGGRNSERHAAFQAIDLHYDHVLPHARGGTNDFDNMLVSCAPCNCGRDKLTLEEAGLADPRTREPIRSSWDGLERFR